MTCVYVKLHRDLWMLRWRLFFFQLLSRFFNSCCLLHYDLMICNIQRQNMNLQLYDSINIKTCCNTWNFMTKIVVFIKNKMHPGQENSRVLFLSQSLRTLTSRKLTFCSLAVGNHSHNDSGLGECIPH